MDNCPQCRYAAGHIRRGNLKLSLLLPAGSNAMPQCTSCGSNALFLGDFCQNCGSPLNNNGRCISCSGQKTEPAHYCKTCGLSLRPTTPVKGRGLYGIRGWLLVFLLGKLLHPIAYVYIINEFTKVIAKLPPEAEILSQYFRVYNFTLIIMLIFVLLCIVLLVLKKPSAPRLTRIYLISSCVFPFIVPLLFINTFGIIHLPEIYAGIAKKMGPDVLWSGIWVLYLLKSRRVRDTYGLQAAPWAPQDRP